jgi:hypothetical protein
MQLKLLAIYLDETQREYIIAVAQGFSQENFNFEFEYFDAQSDFARLHNVQIFPSFFLLKNNSVVMVIEGKLDFLELKERLTKHNYVTNEG